MLSGKGMYLYKIKNAENGDPEQIAQVAYDSGFTHVLIKILDGVWSYNMRPVNSGSQTLWVDDIVKPVVDALHAKNIQAWGWQYVYLSNPVGEADAAIRRVTKLALDGFVVDGEVECKNKPLQAVNYSRRLRGLSATGQPNGDPISVPVALSSYRYPDLHPEFPWRQFLECADLLMPQVYWQGATNAGAQLERSLSQYKKFMTEKPYLYYLPTGSAYTERGWTTKPAELTDFMKTAEDLGLPGVNFWEWNHARTIAGLWDVIANYHYNGINPPPPPPEPETTSVDDFVINTVYPFMVGEGYTGARPVKS